MTKMYRSEFDKLETLKESKDYLEALLREEEFVQRAINVGNPNDHLPGTPSAYRENKISRFEIIISQLSRFEEYLINRKG